MNGFRPVNTAGRAVEGGTGHDARGPRAGSIKKQGRVPAPKTDMGKNHVIPEIRSPDTLHMPPQTF